MANNEGYAGLPDDLAALSDDDLVTLQSAATAAFDAIANDENITEDSVALAAQFADDVEAIRAERTRRQELATDRDSLRARVHSASAEDVVTAAAPMTGNATAVPREIAATRRLNPTLSEIAARAPKVDIARDDSESVLVATADIPGVAQGARLSNMRDLVDAMQARVRTVGVTARGDDAPRYAVATLNRNFRYNLDLKSSPDEISEVLTAASDINELVASGGWCAPSEISYDFFNIVCEDGMLDLPTVGINRGGLRYPVSPDFSSLSGNTALWTWTETQDIAAVTGTAQSGTKTCGRVPCATFQENRLECDGVCLTVGNLMDDAFPELVANHTRLLFAFHAHKMNLRRITALVNGSVLVSGFTGLGGTAEGVVTPVLGSLELQARDYRSKFAMCEDAVLEVILPRWLRGAMRSDLRRRTGIELISVADTYLMGLFDALNIRVQWVGDWQERTNGYPGGSSPLLVWPSQVQALMFAPGTFVLGNGLQLNLGVIRDSVLNATNDFTAAWMEECWLVAKPGHESRRIVINICPNGVTGAANLTACGV